MVKGRHLRRRVFILLFPAMQKGGGIEKNFEFLSMFLQKSGARVIIVTDADIREINVGGSDDCVIVGFRNSLATFLLARRVRKMADGAVRAYFRLNNSAAAFWHEKSVMRFAGEVFKFCFLRFFDGVLCNSREMCAQYRFYTKRRIYLPNHLAASSPSSRKHGGDKITRFVFAGRLTRQKNIIAFAEALRMLAGEAIAVDIYGDGGLGNQMRGMLSGLPFVNFKGWQARIDYGAYDYFILPSLYEGSPNALLEAVAAGVYPVITPFRCGGREVVERVGGITADGFTASAIARAMRDAVAERRAIDKAGRNALLAEHSAENIKKIWGEL